MRGLTVLCLMVDVYEVCPDYGSALQRFALATVFKCSNCCGAVV